MPPIKEYIFEYNQIQIKIKCYSLEEAYEYLVKTTKNPADFILVNN